MHPSLFCHKTSHLTLFPVPRDAIAAFPGASQHSLCELPGAAAVCAGLAPQLGHGGLSSCLPRSAARLGCADDGTAIPDGPAVLLLFCMAAQQHRWEGRRAALMQFVVTP